MIILKDASLYLHDVINFITLSYLIKICVPDDDPIYQDKAILMSPGNK